MGCLTSSTSETESAHIERHPVVSTLRLTLKLKKELPFYIQTPPLINDNKAIFLYTYKNVIRYSIFNLNTCQFITQNQECKYGNNLLIAGYYREQTETYMNSNQLPQDLTQMIKSYYIGYDSFDPFNSVYTLNTSNNKIYFIVNNKDIKILDLNTNQLQSLNKSITTTNNNYASIIYYNNKVFIIGAEHKSDESDQYTLVKFSDAFRLIDSGNKRLELILIFGWFSRSITTTENGENYMYIIGGQTCIPTRDMGEIYCPNDSIWRFNVNTHKWARQRHLIRASHSFGIINYENKYLITFGGEERCRSGLPKPTQYIYLLALIENCKYELNQYMWYEIAKLPKDMEYYFHCVYNNESKIIHLFGYDGKYYTVSVNDLLETLENGNFRQKGEWSVGTWRNVPPESKKIKRMGYKRIDPDEESVGEK